MCQGNSHEIDDTKCSCVCEIELWRPQTHLTNIDMLQATLGNITGGIYSKKAHFLLELIQNADDLSYSGCKLYGEDPTLCIAISAQGLSAG